ncbi:protoheme IX farnesyltransferase mitochondrial precursor [Xylogone sp. PMI_703]|nr:protoheme IX farnesyltransferase mitochondrial precursor [Xylogone sp. PMI_703]
MILRPAAPQVFSSNGLRTTCLFCTGQLVKTGVQQPLRSKRNFANISNVRNGVASAAAPRLRAGYFSANALLTQTRGRNGASTSVVVEGGSITEAGSTASSSIPDKIQELPHRRRQREKKEKEALTGAEDGGTNGPPSSQSPQPHPQPDQDPGFLPQNASSKLTDAAASKSSSSLRRTLNTLLSLSKPRLSVLVVITAMSSYTIFPVPELLQPSSTIAPSLSTLTLVFLTAGTALCSASANTLNMLYEPKWDAMMTRTSNRPLVRGLISTRGAALFALATGIAGTAALYFGVNPTVAGLGAANIVLYAGVYTPLKRISVLNTWIGAIVGGIPPLMGWAAAAGQSATSSGDWRELLFGPQSVGGWLMAALLVAWQFPHFMSLSWSIREEYKNAGYRMLCWVNPARNARVALRYSLAFLPLCVALCYVGVTEWSFAVLSTPVNLWLVREAWKFYKFEGHKGSARGLFWASVWHLPAILVLAMVEKKGMWQRVWRVVSGETVADEDEEDWEEEDEEEAVLSARLGDVDPKARAAMIAMPVVSRR